jgi:hypothetical protein
MARLDLQNILDILAEMAETEMAIAGLYRCCAEAWPADEAFWINLAEEELEHAQNIGEMVERIRRNPDRFQLQRPFNLAAIRTIFAGVKRDAERIRQGILTRERAFVLARDLESSIIEKAYHEIVKTNDRTYLDLIRRIVSQTLLHKNAIEQKIRELRP